MEDLSCSKNIPAQIFWQLILKRLAMGGLQQFLLEAELLK